VSRPSGVVGVFAHVDTTVRAIHALRARGASSFTVYTPMPVDEITEALEGHPLPWSPVRFFTLAGGITGTAGGFALTIWSHLKWGLVTGGKPIVSIPPFVIIAFELTILLGGLATLLAVFLTGRIPLFRRSPGYDPRFSSDHFGIAVECPPAQAAEVRGLLQAAGAVEVRG